LLSTNDIKIDLCKKYGYSEEDLIAKYDSLHNNELKYLWIFQNIEILRNIAFQSRMDLNVPIPNPTPNELKTDEDWDKFFIDNEKYLQPPK
jgi:hypothetical protein